MISNNKVNLIIMMVWQNLVSQSTLDEDEWLTKHGRLVFEPGTALRKVIFILGEIVSPQALGHVDIPLDLAGFNDWSHHQVCAQHELIFNLFGLIVILVFNK